MEITRRQLQIEGDAWLTPGYGLAKFSENELATLRPRLAGIDAEVYLGTWCADTHEHLPAFLRLWDQSAVDGRLKIYSLGREKQPGIEKLPTVVLSRGGRELLRIAEAPRESWVRDLSVLPECLQEKYSAASICFGCGPVNPKGLHVRSCVVGDNEVIAGFHPAPEHQAFPGMLNGGIIGSLLDCHSNWTAAWALMKSSNEAHPPCTVTADYAIRLLRPTPVNGPVLLSAQVVEAKADRATIEATLTAGGKVTATCRGLFVAVKPGHPAYHRW